MRKELSEIKSPVYIFPISCVGIVVYHMMKRQGIKVLGFCDNNKAGGDKNYDGCPALTPDQAVAETTEATFVIASCRYRKDMADQLKSLGVSNIIYAEQILTSEKADEALCDFDDSAATKIITEFESPKKIAKSELPLYLIPDHDLRKNIEIVKEITVHYNSIGYEAECKRFDRIAQNVECVNFVILYYAFLTHGNIMSFISYLLDSKVLIRNIIIQVSYGETYLGKAYELFKQMENLGIEVKKYYISDFSCDGEPIYNYDSSKTPITMIIEDTLYSNFENEYKYIFLHIPKTSGTGLRNYLGNTQRYFFSHKSILEYRDHNQNTFNEFFKFAIVRNPWDRFVSQFFYDNKLRIELNYDKAEVNKASIMGKATFRDAVLALRDNKIIADSQHEWICDENGNILVDYVGRFEKLAESYEYIAKKIGIYTGKPIAKVNASKHKPYQECYDEESKEIVSQYFKKDIELFGYTFD